MKPSSSFICQQCGYKSVSFLGKCPNCGEWNSLVESVDSPKNNQIIPISTNVQLGESLFKLTDVKSHKIERIATGFSEFDRVLGGGIVPGSIVLISGEPGIGKSTLLLQTAMNIASGSGYQVPGAKPHLRGEVRTTARTHLEGEKPGTRNLVLYVTGEESAQQVKIRADRIATSSQLTVDSSRKKKKSVNREPTTDNLFILPQTNIEAILAACERLTPKLLIVDSIQTLTWDKLAGSAGSVGQVRECAQILQRLAKTTGVAIFVVGHVTKEGSIAGPKVLEHLVDAVCHLEGDGMHTFRLLRTLKNRFGSTFEVGVFEMQDRGLVEVENPSMIFLAQRLEKPGSVVSATIAGGRPLLVEVQSLTTSTLFGMPTRRVTGLDFNRVQVVLAAVSRSVNLALGNLDIYVNVAGGLKVAEPACDLAAALAVTSAVVDKPVKPDICVFGEVGLLGELRPVANSASRASEAKRLGFGDIVSADRFKTLEEAVGYAIHEN